MRLRHSPHCVLVVALVLGLTGTARAAMFTLTSKNRQFCCSTPNKFLAGQPGKAAGYQPTVGPNIVTVGGATPAPSIKIGKSEAIALSTKFSWVKGGMTSPPTGFKYIKGTASFANGAGTLKKGGGNPGTLSFCPKAKGPGKGACTNPAFATPASFNGRIYVKPGPNKFGGTLSILGGKGGIGGSRDVVWRWLGAGSNYPAAIVNFKLYSSPVGKAPLGAVRVVSGLKTKLVTHSVGSMQQQLAYFSNAMLSNNGAGPWTTGHVYIGVTKNGSPLVRTVSLNGYDKRTPMGAGNIQVVSGEVFNTFNNIKAGNFPIGWRLRMTLPEPSPSLGLVGGAAALLLFGLVGTRRR